MTETSGSKLKWYILSLIVLTMLFICGAERLSIVVLFKEISLDLNLSLVALGTIWGMDPLAGVFISIPGGLIIDRFGIKRTMITVCILGGIFSALRGLATGFTDLATTMFLFGLISSLVPSLGVKITSVWFKEKEHAFTNAFLFIAISIGQMVGTSLSATFFLPLLGNWRNVLFLYSLPAIVLGILWFTTNSQSKINISKPAEISSTKFRELLPHVIKIKQVWLLGIILAAQIGSLTATSGYVSLYLRNIGWQPVEADTALTIMLGISCLSTIPITVLSDRFKILKPVLVTVIILESISTGLLFTANGSLIWSMLIIYGLIRSIPMVLINVLIIRTKGIGSKYAGTAAGLSATLGMLGGFIFPPLGNSLASIDPGLPFILWACLLAISISGLILTKE